MKHYKLRYVMHDPSEDTENKYMAEIPALPGCRAWGDTPEDALDILQSVAAAFIESYLDHGDKLPSEVVSALVDSTVTNEFLVAVCVTYREFTCKLWRLYQSVYFSYFDNGDLSFLDRQKKEGGTFILDEAHGYSSLTYDSTRF